VKDAVIIKSYHNGITLLLNENVPFEEILREIARIFGSSFAFFKNAKMALALEGRSLTKEEEIAVVEAIQENSNVNIVCIVGKDEATDKVFLQAVRSTDRYPGSSTDGQFYKGSLRHKEVLESETSIIILGDVSAGCKVISAGNIIVLGGLYGEAYAGAAGKDMANYIVALEMAPEKCKIGDFKYIRAKRHPKWGEIRPLVRPKIAYVKDKRIIFNSLTKDLLGDFR